MDFLTFIFIGIGLSMDCFAITLMIGATTKVPPLSAALIIALCFGVFQAGMTMIGWFAGVSLTNFLASLWYANRFSATHLYRCKDDY